MYKIKHYKKESIQVIVEYNPLTFMFHVKEYRGEKILNDFVFEMKESALDMFWFSVSLHTGIDKYIIK